MIRKRESPRFGAIARRRWNELPAADRCQNTGMRNGTNSSPGAASIGRDDRFYHANDRTAQRRILDFHERLDQRMAVGIAEKVGDVSERSVIVAATPRRAAARLRRAFEEERHRHVEDARYLLQP